MDFDELLVEHVGEFGKGQKILFFIVCLVAIPPAFQNMGIVFLAGVPDHWCAVPELTELDISTEQMKNLTIPLEEKDGQEEYSSCKMYKQNFTGWSVDDVTQAIADGQQSSWNTTECNHGWVYDRSIYQSTIVSQWDLVCDRVWMQATASSIYFAGLMVGVLIFGTVADLVGRKPALCIAVVLQVVSAVAVAFSPTIIVFYVLRFFVALFTISLFTSAFVIAMEIVGPSWRVHTGVIIEYFWAFGYILVAGVAYGLRGWFELQLALAIPPVIFFLFICFFPESPRWLYTQRRNEQADVIVRKIAKVNKAKLPDTIDVNMKSEKKGYFWDLVRTPRMRIRSLNIFFNWFVNSLVYYGLSLNTSNLGGNDYLNFVISGGVEIPAYIFVQVTLTYFGRRWPLAGTMVIGGVALLCTLAVPTNLNWIAITLAMVGKFCISASFAIIYVFTAELYPTILRATGVGSGSFCARIGGVIAPYIAQLSSISRFIPLVTFGVVSILAGVLALILPETKGKNLPETLEDGENFGKEPKPDLTEKPTIKVIDNDFGVSSGVSNPSYIPESTRL